MPGTALLSDGAGQCQDPADHATAARKQGYPVGVKLEYQGHEADGEHE
ncbi:hypothetical protein [Streptosporangium sp. 'caverna']|nr:hypothetical protein [Streptosporangium sp. 'caverna']